MGDFGILIAQYNSVLPTLTSGDLSELQVDVNGRLLVQADVAVLIDFLGLNGASDSANILVVGTEDGTGAGTPHALLVNASGALAIQDNGGSITVDALNLDIRDLSSAQDSVQVIGSNGNSIEPNADGSINTTSSVIGTEAYGVTDAEANGGDGHAPITTTFSTVASSAMLAGETAYIYGWSITADKNASGRIVVKDGAITKVYKFGQCTSASPNWAEHFSEGRIEVLFASAGTVEVEMRTKRGSGNGAASVHVRKA